MKQCSLRYLVVAAVLVALTAGCGLLGGDEPSTPLAGVSGSDPESPIKVVSGNVYSNEGSEYVRGVIEIRNDGTCLRPGETGYLVMIDNPAGFFTVADIDRIELTFEWSDSTFVDPDLTVVQTAGPTIGTTGISGTVRNDSSTPAEIWTATVVSWDSNGVFGDWSFVDFDDFSTSSVDESIIAAGASADWAEDPIRRIDTAIGAALHLSWAPPSGSLSVSRSVTPDDPEARLLAIREARDRRARELAAQSG